MNLNFPLASPHEMATKQASFVDVDEGYIDMEIRSSSSNLFSNPKGSPPQNREFEFHITSISNEKKSTTSPADDLFYKGKLLPLHVPPRLQMLQKILNNSNATFEDNSFPFTADRRLPSSNASISPSESCTVSSEVNPDKYLFVWSTEINGFIGDVPKKSWSQKLKQSKQLGGLGQRLKALFSKSGCSDKSSAIAANNVGADKKSKCKECQNKNVNVANDKRNHLSFAVMKNINRGMLEEGVNEDRRSFTGAIRHSTTQVSSLLSTSSSRSSSFSFSSMRSNDLQLSGSTNSEPESSVEGAIAHCKLSQSRW